MNKSLHLYLTRPEAPELSGRLRALVQQARERIGLWVARSNQRRELYELDDRMLRDIGISREQVLAEADKPFWR